MTTKEIQKAVVSVALSKLENPSAKTSVLTKLYLDQNHPNWSLGELFVIDMHAQKLASDKKFQSMIKIERQEYVNVDSGEIVTITQMKFVG